MRSCHGNHQVNSKADVIVLCSYLVPSIMDGISMVAHIQHSLKQCIFNSFFEVSPARWLTLRPQWSAASRRHDQKQVRQCQSLQTAAAQPPTAACGQAAADMAVPHALDAPVARLCAPAVSWEQHQITAEALIEASRMSCFANGYCTKAASFQARLMVWKLWAAPCVTKKKPSGMPSYAASALHTLGCQSADVLDVYVQPWPPAAPAEATLLQQPAVGCVRHA